jgi:hypothetical protein
MSLGASLLAVLRLAAILVPAWLAARCLRTTVAAGLSGAPAVLADAIAALSALLICCELLGLLGLLQAGPMIAALCLLALAGIGLARRDSSGSLRVVEPIPAPAPARRAPGSVFAASAGVVVVAAQWLLQSANSLGSGMLNFDTLWYHMPVAAQFARTGSVTAVQFTLADPYVAIVVRLRAPRLLPGRAQATEQPGRYSYVVLTPAPTRAIPLTWTASDRAAKLVMNPAPGFYVFSLHPGLSPGGCA